MDSFDTTHMAIFLANQHAADAERERVCLSARTAWQDVNFGVRDV